MGETGSLIMRLKMDASNMEKELNRAARNTDDFGKLVSGAAKIGTLALGALTAVAATTGAALISMAKSSVNVGDELSKTAQKTGVSVETLSGLRFAADLSDVSMEQLSTSMGKMARAQQDASMGSKEARTTFQALGISYKEADGTLRPLNDVMLDAADRLAALDDETKRAALAQELFGKSGMQMLPLLNQGSAAIRAQMEEAKALGVVWTTDAAQGAEAFNDSLTRLGYAAEGFRNDVAQVLIPILNDVTDGVLSWVKANREWIKDEIQRDVRALAAAATELVSVMGTIVKTSIDIKNSSFVDGMIQGLRILGDVMHMVIDYLHIALLGFGRLVAMLGSILTIMPKAFGGDIGEKFQAHVQEYTDAIEKAKMHARLSLEAMQLDMGLLAKNSAGHLDVVTKKFEQTAQAATRARHALKAFPTIQGPNQDAQAIDFYNAEREVALGKMIVEQTMEQYRLTLAEGRAQEALGGIVNARFKNEQDLAKQTADLQHSLWMEQMADGRKQIALIEEEAATRAKFIKDNVSDELERASLLENVERSKTMKLAALKLDEQKKELDLFEELRQAAMTGEDAQRFEIEKTAEARRRQVMETIKDAQMQALALENIEIAKKNKIQTLAGQQKDMWITELEAIKQSAAFTWASIVQGFSNATAGIIQGTTTWAEFMKQMFNQLLVTVISVAVRAAAAWVASEATRTSASVTANATIAASGETTGSGLTAVFGAAGTTIKTIMLGLARGVITIVGLVISAVTTVLQGISFVLQFALQAIAEMIFAAAAAVQSIPIVGQILGAIMMGAGMLVMAASIALPALIQGLGAVLTAGVTAVSGSIPAFGGGGIMTGPTIGQFAEAGDAEAAIPLNDRGAKFMQSAMGFGGGGPVTIYLQVDSRTMAKAIVPRMHDVIHTKLGYT